MKKARKTPTCKSATRQTAKGVTSRPDVYQLVTDRIVAALEGGVIPWRKPWNAVYGLPRNYATGAAYSGINAFLLHFSGALPFFLTFKQALALGGNVRKGAKGHPVVYYNVSVRENEQTGKEEKLPFLKYYTVFSVEDIEGIEFDLPAVERHGHTPIEAAEAIVSGWEGRPAIEHRHQRAYYSPALDLVNMPERATFTTGEGYYATLFHELTHSTGHASRLDRPDLTASEGKLSASYAREELTAEMGASFLCAASGLNTEQTETNAVAYIQSWLERLKNDKKLVLQAASKAQRAAKLILGVPEEGETAPAPARVLELVHEEDEVGRQYREAELSWLAAA
ncbi:ssDNA-binding domain-containing protein [Hymenobacter sp. BT635]|uniref:SsDNA-binding domain-containing protein n=1 Tax=Hymenobacter nitidus TaxID=2880929 RepID=A0ABS8AIY4_9BACT|nr:zincin-like metallopeptidase domain-containing protein [Hymenobacter nitidus]MCB2380396.1 ssDNA-binding domain-containing protein [Hymenobacter nitidus]